VAVLRKVAKAAFFFLFSAIAVTVFLCHMSGHPSQGLSTGKVCGNRQQRLSHHKRLAAV